MKIKKGDAPELKLKKMDGSDFDLNNFKGKKSIFKIYEICFLYVL